MEARVAVFHDASGQSEQRRCRRHHVSVPGRMVWRDARGTTRFATVVTRDVSEFGVLVECLSGAPIPQWRLVHLQLDREASGRDDLPECLRQGKVLSAIYRVGPTRPATGAPQSYALRLLIEPPRKHVRQVPQNNQETATA